MLQRLMRTCVTDGSWDTKPVWHFGHLRLKTAAEGGGSCFLDEVTKMRSSDLATGNKIDSTVPAG